MLRLMTAVLAAVMTAMAVYADTTGGEDSYEATATKARRFFENREWLNASAMYTLMLHSRPDVAENYGYAIVSNEMTSDTIAVRHLLEQSMVHNVPLDSVLNAVKSISINVGSPTHYEQLLYSVRRTYPWMSRSIDMYLMRYYVYRDNGPMMKEYALKMLAGMPDNTEFNRILARGCMLMGEFDEAVRVWKEILKTDPDNYDTLLDLGNYYMTEGDHSAARPYLEQACDMRPTPYVKALLEKCDAKGKKHQPSTNK